MARNKKVFQDGLLNWKKNQLQSLSDQKLSDVFWNKRDGENVSCSFQIQCSGTFLCLSLKRIQSELKRLCFPPCLAERTPVRGLLFDFPYVLEFFLLSRAVCGEGEDTRIKAGPAMFDEHFK